MPQRYPHIFKCAIQKNGHQERGEDVNLLTYLKEAPEQNDGQLQKDLQSHSPSADLADDWPTTGRLGKFGVQRLLMDKGF